MMWIQIKASLFEYISLNLALYVFYVDTEKSFYYINRLGTESSVQLTCTGLENAVKDCEPVVITTECIESVELRCKLVYLNEISVG